MSDSYEVKNTAPAVMTDAGPRGSTRKKSKDGRYTAAEAEDEYVDERQTKVYDNRNRSQDLTEKIMNTYVYGKLFVRAMERTLVQDLLKIKRPEEEPYLIRSNSYNDEKLGIDYQLGLRYHDKNGVAHFNENTIYEVDLKVADTFGKAEDYEHPRIALNLWKRYPNGMWEEGAYLNRNHRNNYYCYIIPKSELRKKVIASSIRRDPNYAPLQDVEEAKSVLVAKRDLRRYADERIINNQSVQEVIDMFKLNDIQKLRSAQHNPLYNYMKEEKETTSFTFDIPVPGETFKARLALRTDESGYREIKVLLPEESFNNITCSKNVISLK